MMRAPRRFRALTLLWLTALAVTPAAADTFTNPILGAGADPWVTQWQGQYFYVRSSGGQLYVDRSTNLQSLGSAGIQSVWTPPSGTSYSQNLWAPELHYLNNKWYMYVAADDGPNANHRMHVLEGTSQDPQGTYVYKGKIAAATDRWAIDGSVLTLNGSNYFVWSGWPGTTNGQQNLYIAAMSNPWTISGERVLISSPTLAWERHGLNINEGPTALQKDGKTHIIYSASGYWTDEYALGQLTLTGANPLSASSWTKKTSPVFSQTPNTAGPGHASFTKSPDGGQDWIVYHAHNDPGVFDHRDVRTQQFHYNGDNSPDFGSPVTPGVPINAPSGRAVVTFIPNSSFERNDVTSNGGAGQGLGVARLKSTGFVGVTDNQGRFFTPIAGGEGRQVGFIGSSGANSIFQEIGQIVKPGTYSFSAGLAVSSNQLSAATAAPTSYLLRLESVGLKPDGTPNEADKILLGTTTVDSTSLNALNFSFSGTNGAIPFLSDRYNTLLRLGVYSSGTGGGSWQAKIENLSLNFTPHVRPAVSSVAYYRFDEGPAGAALTGTNGDNALSHTTTADAAGGDDNLRTFNFATGFDTSPKYSTDVPAAVIPATGAVNRYSFDFSPNQDVYTKVPGELEGKVFSAFTLEASFKLDNLNRYHGLVGKDGKPTALALAPLQLKARNDNDRAQIEILDAAGNPRQVSSVDALAAGQWYNVAAVNDGTTMSFYLDRGDGLGYVLQGTTPVTGALINSTATWTVGRGFYNGGIADWTDGKIDEVRITASALDPTQFLFYDPAGMPVWNVNAGGNWSSQPNWSRAQPNSINATAYFTDAIRGDRTITVDGPRTVAGLVFDNDNRYTLAGTGAITLDTNGALGAINVLSGRHTIAAPLVLMKDTSFNVVPVAGALQVSGPLTAAGVRVTKTGSGELEVNHVRAKALTVTGGAVIVAPNGTGAGVSKVETLSIAGGARLHLNDNDLLIDYTGASVESTIRQLVRNGRATGSGITTATTADTVLAIADNAELNRPSHEEIAIDASTIIGKYTYFGDANLDGMVTGDDYLAIDTKLGIGDDWIEGDFNMDTAVTGDDYLAIDSNLGKGTLTPLAWAGLKEEMIARHVEMFGDDYLQKLAAVEANGFGSLVPEPAGAGLVLTGLLAAAVRRR